MYTRFLSPTCVSLTSPFALQVLVFSWFKLTLSPPPLVATPATTCDFQTYPSLPNPPLSPYTCHCHFCSLAGEISIFWPCLVADHPIRLGLKPTEVNAGYTTVSTGLWISLLQPHKASVPCPCGKQVWPYWPFDHTDHCTYWPFHLKWRSQLPLLRPGSLSAQLPTGWLCTYWTASRITKALL